MKCLLQYKPDSSISSSSPRFLPLFYAPYLMNEVHVCLSLSVNRNVHAVMAFLCEKQEQQSIKLESAQGVQTSAKAVSVSAGDNFSRGTIWLGTPKSWHLPRHPHTKFQPASWTFIVELHAQCWTWPYLAMIKNPSNISWMHMVIRVTPQFNELFLVSLPSYPENFIKIR